MSGKKVTIFDKIGRFFSHKLDADEAIISPNGRVVCRFILKSGHVYYSVLFDEKVIVKESRLGFTFRGEAPLRDGLALVRMRERSVDENWETIWGEEKIIRNYFNEKIFYLEEPSGKQRLFTVKFRVFNDGIAFRYEIPPQPSFSRVAIEDELTEFNIGANTSVWCIPANQPDRYEYNYEKKMCFELNEPVHTPMTAKITGGPYISIHEAALYNYGEMTLQMGEWKTLKTNICQLSDGIKAYVELPFETPWRVIMIGERAIDLVQNRMTLNLNEKPKQDFSWVKPIKFIGIWWAMYVGEWTWAPGERHGASTEHALEYLGAAKRLGMDGLLMEGWNNGWEGDWLQNGQYTDFTEPAKDLDLTKVSKHAKELGIELIGHHETVGFVDNYEKQLDKAYDFCAKYGINYIKSGYAGSSMLVQGRREYHHSQVGVNHYQRALELAAKYHICLDVHEPIKGTGIERTWPNLLTREGARGQEYEGGAISPSHACYLPFTRLLSGPMDYTSGIFDITNGTKRIATTLARQLAYFVTIPSGMQMAADRPKFYEEVQSQAFQFIKDVPVNWEKSLALTGEIGEYYVVARQGRNEENWYIGGITNEMPRKFRVRLDFLDSGDYLAEIYRDGENAHYRENPLAIKIESFVVNKDSNLEILAVAGGGFAVRLVKK